MPLHGARLEHLSDSEIAQLCFDTNRQVVGGLKEGNLVIKLSGNTVVKFGIGVTAEEANNQRNAFELLDPSIVRVPRLYRFFTRDNPRPLPPTGFIVMEYIHGETLEKLSRNQVQQIAQVISHFSAIHCQIPGPLGGGRSHGAIWEESGNPEFKSVRQMEAWLNHRLPNECAKLALAKYPLIICHLDLAPRNMIWPWDNSPVCLLDWASAGFYPRFFEVCALKLIDGSNFGQELIESLVALTEDEEAQVSVLECSIDRSLDYSFVSCPTDCGSIMAH
jgi:serine/threonine protein kinase